MTRFIVVWSAVVLASCSSNQEVESVPFAQPIGNHLQIEGIDIWTDSIPLRAFAVVQAETVLPSEATGPGQPIDYSVQTARRRAASIAKQRGGDGALVKTGWRVLQGINRSDPPSVPEFRVTIIRYQ